MPIKLALLFAIVALFSRPAPSASDALSQPATRADRLGIAHISIAGEVTPPERYQKALQLGAGWNRWPLYWDRISPASGVWDWSAYDRQVHDDLRHGLQINAILLGAPSRHRAGDSISGLHAPIFSDGSDEPGAGKAINPGNPWALYVWNAVRRYRPGGLLSIALRLPPDAGIRVWEVWNEPDFENFWRGGVNDYARMLKVSYIVIKSVDPSAQVMFGGLLYPTEQNFLARVLDVIAQDPDHQRHNWYMDLVGVHSYIDPWRSGWLTVFTRQTMRAFGFERPIWINESGVSVWDDYPGPTWRSDTPHLADLQQQAWYFIQSTAHAWHAGAEKVFYHQLYDDCGDQPAGTDFPPHNGDLCRGDGWCYGDAFGIFRNHPSSICFSQHPAPGTARPVADAFRLMSGIFGAEPFRPLDSPMWLDERFTLLAFERPRTDERILVMWNRRTAPATIEIEPVGVGGRLVSLQSNLAIHADGDGLYRVTLPPATASAVRSGGPYGGLAIGGMPYILIERRSDDVIPLGVDPLPSETPAPTLTPAPTPTFSLGGSNAPQASILPLPETSPPRFEVNWVGEGDVDYFVIWAREAGGDWQSWQTTDETGAIFDGTPGQTYEFAAWMVDSAGNWSDNVRIQPQAATTVEGG